MPHYEYDGDTVRTFPTLGITVKKGDSFDGPAGLKAQGLSIASSAKAAPVAKETKEIKETKKESELIEQMLDQEYTIESSAPSDTITGV